MSAFASDPTSFLNTSVCFPVLTNQNFHNLHARHAMDCLQWEPCHRCKPQPPHHIAPSDLPEEVHHPSSQLEFHLQRHSWCWHLFLPEPVAFRIIPFTHHIIRLEFVSSLQPSCVLSEPNPESETGTAYLWAMVTSKTVDKPSCHLHEAKCCTQPQKLFWRCQGVSTYFGAVVRIAYVCGLIRFHYNEISENYTKLNCLNSRQSITWIHLTYVWKCKLWRMPIRDAPSLPEKEDFFRPTPDGSRQVVYQAGKTIAFCKLPN